MKYQLIIFFSVLCLKTFAQLPEGFVEVSDSIPDLDVELRYHGSNNFVGMPIDGYRKHKLIVTLPTAKAIKSVHEELQNQNLDLTIIDGNTGIPLDMGSPYDFFGEASWVNYNGITKEQKANRQLLQNIMLKHGFRNYPKEWWHFTLRGEPFPNTYFDFPIK